MIPVLFDLDEKDVVKWILVFLFKRRFALSVLTLKRESEVTHSEHFLADLRQIIVEGDWKMADELILSLRVDEMVCRRIRFLLKRQQVFECFQQWKKCKDVETSSNEMQHCVQKENGCTEQDEGMQNGMQWCVEQKDLIKKRNGRYLETWQHVAKESCDVYNVALHHYSELKELKSGDHDVPDLSELLDIDYNAEDSDLLDDRIMCFSAIYPLVCKALPACIDKMADKTDDRLIELLVKGCFFESFEKYFRSKANCEELYVNNGPRTNLTRSSDLSVVSLVAKLLSDVDASLPLKFTAETVELNASIRRCEKAPLSSDMTRLDNSFQIKRVTVIPTTKSLSQFSISDISTTQVCDADFNEKNKFYKCQEESSSLLDGILISKPEIVNDSGCEKLEFVPSSVMIMQNSVSDIPDSDSDNGWNEGLMDANPTLASGVTEVSNCETIDTNKKDSSKENLETGFDLLNGELRTNPFPAKTENPVFRQRQHCCEFCGKLMRSSSEMLRHIRTHRPDANRLIRKCHQCLRLFADESSFELHVRLHDEPLHCGICQRSFIERVKLERHVMKNHTTREELGCVPCKERFTSETELAIHMNRHLENNNFNLSESPGVDGETRAGRGEFACDLCGKRFRGSGALRKHAQSHTQERPHGCVTCGKKFLRLEHLQLHERIHSGEKPFRCEICDYSSRQQNGLKTHMKQHSADHPFSCPGCGKQFSLLCRLKTHLLDATDRSDYSCPTCLMEFHYACALKDHAKTHAASKAFACDVCGRKFSRKHDMMLHALLHSNAKPYVCGICKSGFSSKSYVKEHLGSHIGDGRCCNACDQVFKDSAELLSHMEQHIEGDWLKCRKCGRMLGNGLEFREHQMQCCTKNLSGCKRRKPPKKVSCDGEKRSYQCSDCGYTTSSKSQWYRHRKKCRCEKKTLEKVKII